MCTLAHERSGKARAYRVAGNLCLAAGLILWNFTGHSHGPWQSGLHALCGLLFGIAIGVNLSGLLCVRRCRARSV